MGTGAAETRPRGAARERPACAKPLVAPVAHRHEPKHLLHRRLLEEPGCERAAGDVTGRRVGKASGGIWTPGPRGPSPARRSLLRHHRHRSPKLGDIAGEPQERRRKLQAVPLQHRQGSDLRLGRGRHPAPSMSVTAERRQPRTSSPAPGGRGGRGEARVNAEERTCARCYCSSVRVRRSATESECERAQPRWCLHTRRARREGRPTHALQVAGPLP